MTRLARRAVLRLFMLSFTLCSVCLAANDRVLVVQNESKQQLFVQLEPSDASERSSESAKIAAPPRGSAVAPFDRAEVYNITIQWMALADRRTYTFYTLEVPLRDFLRASKQRPTTRLLGFWEVEGERDAPWENAAPPAPRQWKLWLRCTTTPHEALIDFPQLAVSDPRWPIPTLLDARRRGVLTSGGR